MAKAIGEDGYRHPH